MEIEIIPIQKIHEAEDMYDVTYSETRYVITSKETGEILDDAQGYGYKSKQKAHVAWTYKHRDKVKEAERKKLYKEINTWVNNPPLTKPTVLLKWGLAKASTKSQGL